MADDDAPREDFADLLRPLVEVGVKRRDRLRRVGGKVLRLARLARAGVPVPNAWVLDGKIFESFAEGSLPRKHDLKSLIKLAGTRAGADSCARAYDALMAAPLPDELVKAVEALVAGPAANFSHGLAVRPSLAGSGAADHASRHLHSVVGLSEAGAILDAIRTVWASAVLPSAVRAYDAVDLSSVRVAVMLQEAVPVDARGLLVSTRGLVDPGEQADWHLGVNLDAHDDAFARAAQLLIPMSLGEGSEAPPRPLAVLREALGDRGFEQLAEIGAIAREEIGDHVVVHFVAEPGSDPGHTPVRVIAADESPRWRALEAGDAGTLWSALTLGGAHAEPPMELSADVIDRAVRGAIEGTLESLRCEIDDDVVLARWSDRSYLNVSALSSAVRDVPLVTPESLLHAVGGGSAGRLTRLARRVGAAPRSRWRLPWVAGSALSEQWRLDGEVEALEQGIREDARSIQDMDLTILPTDGVATTLISARALVERATELWCKCAAAQVVALAAVEGLIARRVGEVEPRVAYTICAGTSGTHATAMARQLDRVAQAFRRDARAAERLAEGPVRAPDELPDGPARGALGQFLASYGDMAFGAFEVSRPRWREDASDLTGMLRARMAIDGLPLPSRGDVRAVAEATLARYEPELGPLERRLLRTLIDRAKEVARLRVTVDRLVFRALSLLRIVVLDIDRRLRRIDPTLPAGGAFHCSTRRLVAALKSGRPELSRIIRMRSLQRAHKRSEPAPPLSFVGAPPRGAIPIAPTATLQGAGVSSGVAEGRARVVHGPVPQQIEPGDILVMSGPDAALAPTMMIAGGLVCASGGALSMAADAARELMLPSVFSVQDATLRITDGERLRIDGERGTVQRLDAMPVRPSRLPPAPPEGATSSESAGSESAPETAS